jgi:hypothetical protein
MVNDGKIVVARCGAGLGSRINILIGATYVAEALNAQLHIVWVPTEACDCEFYDIFERVSENINITIFNTIDYYVNAKVNGYFDAVVTDTKNPLEGKEYQCDSFNPRTICANDLNSYHFILYQNNFIPDILKDEEIVNILSYYTINNSILRDVMSFVQLHNIDHTVNGYHVRLTDSFRCAGIRSDADKAIKIIEQTQSQRFFICSCDQQFEKKASEYPNVIYRKKKSQPCLIESESMLYSNVKKERILQCNTEHDYPYNYIDKDAVIDAFIDLLILSRTNIIQQHPLHSNFRKLANLYSSVYFGKTFLKYNNKITKFINS